MQASPFGRSYVWFVKVDEAICASSVSASGIAAAATLCLLPLSLLPIARLGHRDWRWRRNPQTRLGLRDVTWRRRNAQLLALVLHDAKAPSWPQAGIVPSPEAAVMYTATVMLASAYLWLQSNVVIDLTVLQGLLCCMHPVTRWLQRSRGLPAPSD